MKTTTTTVRISLISVETSRILEERTSTRETREQAISSALGGVASSLAAVQEPGSFNYTLRVHLSS